MNTVHYASLEDKRLRYVRETIPLIFTQAAAAALEERPGFASPRDLHEFVRTGRYVSEDGPKDEVRSVADTLQVGGDCDDWAAVLLGLAWNMGWPARLVTAGSELDPFEHVYVEIHDGRHWVPSDPKGSQRGLDFGRRSAHDLVRRFVQVNGAVREVISGSGLYAPERERELRAALARVQFMAGFFRPNLSEPGNAAAAQLLREALRDDPYRDNAAEIRLALRAVGYADTPADAPRSSVVSQPAPVQMSSVALQVDDDRFVAAFVVAEMPAPQVFAVTDAMEVAGTLDQRRAALADWLAIQARLDGVALRVKLQRAGLSAPPMDSPSGSGFVDLKKLGKSLKGVEDVAKQKIRAVQTGIGAGLQAFGAGVLALGNKHPWVNQFFSKPLGLHLFGTAVQEIGNAIRDGSINTFDEKRLTRATASWFTAVGQAIAVAAPFTGPWAPLFSAIAATNIAIGKTIGGFVAKKEAERALARAEEQYRAQSAGQAQAVRVGVHETDWGPEWGLLWTHFDAAGRPTHVWLENEWRAVRA